MKSTVFNTFVTCILLFISSVSLAQTQPNNGNTIRVMSFNIYHGETTKGDFNLDNIARVITNAEPDFVAMQEVDFKTNRGKKYDLATELGWRTKMASIFGRAMDFDGGEYGEAILSKYTFVSSRNVPLPHALGNEPRTALEITTVLPSGDTIAIVGTHLDHLNDEKDRIAQAQKINDVFRLNKYPTLLVGDLNAEPGSTPITMLEQLWTATYDSQNPKFTYPSTVPIKKIDYVMFYPKNRWEVHETAVIADSIASDHCAYLVSIELLPE